MVSHMTYQFYTELYKNHWVGNTLACDCVQVVYKHIKYKYKIIKNVG